MIQRSLLLFVCLGMTSGVFSKTKYQDQDTVVTTSPSLNDSLYLDKVGENIPTVTLEDVETNDESGSDQGVSAILSAGRDPFLSAAAFNWGITRFRIRGYDNDFYDTYMNGIPTEYIDNGFSSYNLWSGLNDVTRNRENSIGLKLSTFAFGSVGGVYAIDTRASKQRKQLSVTIGTSNRTYDLRGGVTWGSGITKKGWSFAVSVFGRWAKKGYVEGTGMQSISYFASIQKMFKNQSLSLTAFGVPTKQGKAAATTQEAYDLAGSNYYNPNWGYQDGKVRNSRVEYRHQPVIILTHEWKPKENMNLMTAAGYSFGERALSGFDRYNAADPRPDYYRYLPSYIEDTAQRLAAEEFIRENPEVLQVQWNDIYFANKSQGNTTINNVDGVNGNSVTGKRATYVLRDDVQKYQRFNFNTVYNATVKIVDITAGASYQFQQTNQFKRVKDLLGADYYVDVDEFIESDSGQYSDAAQSDLNHPNRVVKVGDKYGYNYNQVIHKAAVWGQTKVNFKKFDISVGTELSYTSQYRFGKFKNGINPDHSQGKSASVNSFNYAVKAGITYKINGRNYLFANGMYMTRAPFWNKIFISNRTSNEVAADVRSEKVGSVEFGYIFVHPKVKLRATGFYTNFKDGSNSITFYDDFYESLGNYTVTQIDKVHAGVELGLEASIYKGLSATLAASIGKYFYNDRQVGIETVDTDPTFKQVETIYSKGLNVAGSPQQAYALGLNYRSKKFWYVGATVNFFDWMWTDFAPTHRTERAVDAVPYQSEQYNSILQQERLSKKGEWTLDLSGGYSWRLKSTFKNMNGKNASKYYLVLNAGISNVTNNKTIVVGAREQLRFDYEEKDASKFPSRYSYAYGINFFLNLTFRM
ncbi:MAG: TonB-dependent receptor [Chitinophagales bacterium]|nr:TonB-dependent receptor [Chitinophagales bacterium]